MRNDLDAKTGPDQRSNRIAAAVLGLVLAALALMLILLFNTSDRYGRVLSIVAWIAAGGATVLCVLAWVMTPRPKR